MPALHDAQQQPRGLELFQGARLALPPNSHGVAASLSANIKVTLGVTGIVNCCWKLREQEDPLHSLGGVSMLYGRIPRFIHFQHSKQPVFVSYN